MTTVAVWVYGLLAGWWAGVAADLGGRWWAVAIIALIAPLLTVGVCGWLAYDWAKARVA